MLSGIPQGSVLGPVLFVVYINDLLENIESHGVLFADDAKIFKRISSREDSVALQADINSLRFWSKSWLLTFILTNVMCLQLESLQILGISTDIRSTVWN